MLAKGPILTCSLAAVLAVPSAVYADEFIGFGYPSPAGWSAQLYPGWSKTKDSPSTTSAFAELAYFTPTGFTGTSRDRHEFWIAADAGYTKPTPGSSDSGTGIVGEQLAYEYYFNVIEPTKEDSTTWWTTPIISLSFPNGSSKSSGFGAGGNQYAYSFTWNNYVGVGKWGVTAAPVSLYYSDRSHNTTALSNGDTVHLRGGLSITLADIAAGYQVNQNVYLGLHHAYSLFNYSSSDFAKAREGKIGPAFSYLGLLQPYGVFVAGNLNFDYYTSPGMKKSTSFAATIVKSF